MKKHIKLIRSAPIDGKWREPGWTGEVLTAEADVLIRMGKAVAAAEPSRSSTAKRGSAQE